MPPRSRLSREEKGKDIATSPSPTRDVTANGSPLDEFDLIHRDALRDTENMSLSQRLLVADAHRQIREGADHVEVGSSDVSGSENFFESAQAIATHSHLRWPDLSREWIRRQHARIARVDWESRLPCVLDPRKSRLSLFTRKQQKLLNKTREMEGVPDLSALLKGKLQLLSKKTTSDVVPESTHSEEAEASKGRDSTIADEDIGAEPSTLSRKKKKKSKKAKKTVTDEAPGADVPLGEAASLGEASKGSKAKKKKEGKKRPREGTTSPVDHNDMPREGREATPEDLVEAGPIEAVLEDRPKKKTKKRSVGVVPRPIADGTTPVDSAGRKSLSPETPLEKRRKVAASEGGSRSESAESKRSAPDSATRRGARSEGDLYFKDEYVDAAFTRARSDRSMNFLVEKYDSTLKQTMIQLGSSEKLAQARLKAIERLEGKLKSYRVAKKELAREKARLEQAAATLEKEKAELLEERDTAVEKLIKERQRLKDSRSLEFTRERVMVQAAMTDKVSRCFGRVRDYFTRLDAFGKEKNLYGQASGTRKCLEMIKDSGTEIPQEVIYVFAEQEQLHEATATKLHVDPLSDNDLTLSPLVLPSRFVEDRFRAPFYPYGWNADLIEPEMASQLITSREITEEPSEEPMVDITPAPTKHAEVSGKDTLEECPEKDNLDESPEKDNPETDGILVREEGTENVGTEDPVLVSDTSSEEREDEEEEGDRAEKMSSPKLNEEETNSEIKKRSVSRVPSSNADLLVPISAQVEGPIAPLTEDPVDPTAPSVLNGDDQDSAT
ncbi:hypothetical protein F2Q70_00039535 [Brassica cretica]|uniref:DUF1204 domain-containing protein n=1 Tax=Brassica cretica TaxID=69181 RepID=A0A8S9KC34_BRACR|nr:hypothetical protein F2Q70_00039535 [Brassica cretica]